MKKVLLIFSLLALAATAPAQKRASNRYGQPLVQTGDRWQPANAEVLARFCDRLDTIPEYDVPYTYVPDRITAADYEKSVTEERVYKRYPGYELKLAVDMPAERPAKPTPYIMLIHGGGWRSGSYDSARQVDMGRYLAGNGIAVVRVSYTLSGQGDMEDGLADLRDAIAYIEEHAAEFNIDPTRIGFSGSSAGGHLSSLMAMTHPGTKGLVSFCGPHDATWYDWLWKYDPDKIDKAPHQRPYFRYDGTPASLEKYSPFHRIPARRKDIPAVMLVHGTFDLLVHVDQSRSFARQLREKGAGTVILKEIPCGSHGFLHHNAYYEETMSEILAFAKKHL